MLSYLLMGKDRITVINHRIAPNGARLAEQPCFRRLRFFFIHHLPATRADHHRYDAAVIAATHADVSVEHGRVATPRPHLRDDPLPINTHQSAYSSLL